MQQWILFFVVMDAIIVAVVFWWITTKRQHRETMKPGPNLDQMTRFAGEIAPHVRDYMAATFDGNPDSLPGVLTGLRARIESRARAAGLDLGGETIEALIARSLADSNIARERDVHRAFQDIRSARTDG